MPLNTQTTANLKPATLVCLYGPGKSGKTIAAASAPNPYFFSADRNGLVSIRSINLPYLDINSPPQGMGAFTYFENQMYEFEKVMLQFGTLIIDDLTELCDLFLVENKEKIKDGRQRYGEMQDKILFWIRRWKTYKIKMIVIAKQERIQDGGTGGLIYAPMIPGKSLSPLLPHLADEIYHMEQTTDPQTKQMSYVMRTRRDPMNQYDAGSRYGKLPDLIYGDFKYVFDCIEKG